MACEAAEAVVNIEVDASGREQAPWSQGAAWQPPNVSPGGPGGCGNGGCLNSILGVGLGVGLSSRSSPQELHRTRNSDASTRGVERSVSARKSSSPLAPTATTRGASLPADKGASPIRGGAGGAAAGDQVVMNNLLSIFCLASSSSAVGGGGEAAAVGGGEVSMTYEDMMRAHPPPPRREDDPTHDWYVRGNGSVVTSVMVEEYEANCEESNDINDDARKFVLREEIAELTANLEQLEAKKHKKRLERASRGKSLGSSKIRLSAPLSPPKSTPGSARKVLGDATNNAHPSAATTSTTPKTPLRKKRINFDNEANVRDPFFETEIGEHIIELERGEQSSATRSAEL